MSGDEQVYSASVPADTETGPETVTAEGGSEHHTDKKIPKIQSSLPMTVTTLVLCRYPSRSPPAKQVTYKVLLSAMAVTNMLVLDMWWVGRGVRSWSITTRRGGEGGWPVE